MEWLEFILGMATLIMGGGWLFTWRSHKRSEAAKAKQEEEKAKQEAATAKQQEADAFKSMQDAYQQTLEDVKNTLEEVRAERDHYRDERNFLRKENHDMRDKYIEIEKKMVQMELEYKQDISRLGRRIDVLSPFLCGVAGCMHRKKVSLMENIDDNSFATQEEREENENNEQKIGDKEHGNIIEQR